MHRSTSRKGGIISGLLFVGMMVFLMMFISGVVITRTIHVRHLNTDDGGEVAIDTPGGRLDIRAHDHMNPAINGVPIYPGAYRADDGGANIEWTSSDGRSDKNLYIIGGEFRTDDSVQQVVEFYRHQLPSLMIVSRRIRGTHIGEYESVRLEYKDGGLQRIISIEDRHGETRIGVASIGDRASN